MKTREEVVDDILGNFKESEIDYSVCRHISLKAIIKYIEANGIQQVNGIETSQDKALNLADVKARIVEELMDERFSAMKKGDYEQLYQEQGDIHYGEVNGIDKAIEIIEKYVP